MQGRSVPKMGRQVGGFFVTQTQAGRLLEGGAKVPAPKYTEEQKAEALRLVQEIGQSETARRLDIPRGTVCWWATRAGLKSAGAEKTREATEAASAKNAALRAEIAAGLLQDAARLRAQLFSRSIAYNFGGKDNTFSEHELSEPGFRDKQAILTSIGIALDKAVMLERHDHDNGQAAALDLFLDALRKS